MLNSITESDIRTRTYTIYEKTDVRNRRLNPFDVGKKLQDKRFYDVYEKLQENHDATLINGIMLEQVLDNQNKIMHKLNIKA